MDERRRVIVERADEELMDPFVHRFLEFLAQDMIRNPGQSVVGIPVNLLPRIAALTDGMAVDVEDFIEGDVDL